MTAATAFNDITVYQGESATIPCDYDATNFTPTSATARLLVFSGSAVLLNLTASPSLVSGVD